MPYGGDAHQGESLRLPYTLAHPENGGSRGDLIPAACPPPTSADGRRGRLPSRAAEDSLQNLSSALSIRLHPAAADCGSRNASPGSSAAYPLTQFQA